MPDSVESKGPKAKANLSGGSEEWAPERPSRQSQNARGGRRQANCLREWVRRVQEREWCPIPRVEGPKASGCGGSEEVWAPERPSRRERPVA